MPKHKQVSKNVAILGMISNLLIFTLVVVGLVLGLIERKGQDDWYSFFFFFTTISNLLLGISSVFMAIYSGIAIKTNKLPRIVTIFKFVATVCTTLTIATVFIVFGIIMKADFLYLIDGSNFFFHLIVPILGFISMAVIEQYNKLKFGVVFLGLIPGVIYGILYAVGYYLKWPWFKDDKYGFIALSPVVSILLVTFILITVSVMVWGVTQINSVEDVEKEEEIAQAEKEEISEIETIEKLIEKDKSKQEKEAKKQTKKEKKDKPVEKVVEPKEEKENDVARTYHISRTKDGDKWQVKLAKGKKAIKLFDTQAEAINYAKGLVETQGGSIRIHSKKGSIRKE